jgi:hypothetical protein
LLTSGSHSIVGGRSAPVLEGDKRKAGEAVEVELRVYRGEIVGKLIVAMFLVWRGRGTGTRDGIRWLPKLGYDEGIHLSKDFSMEET